MISSWDTAALLTMKQAAEALGITRPNAGRWLKRYIMKRQRDTGREILIVTSKASASAGVRYGVQLAELIHYCPELAVPSARSQLAMQEALRSVRHDIQALSRSVEELSSRMAMLTEAVIKAA